MNLKRPVTVAQALRWPGAAKRRQSFCARMGGMREKLTGKEAASDPESPINRALAAWDCDDSRLLDKRHVSKGIRPMKITAKMIGSEAKKNPIGRQETYVLAEENLANLKKRYQAVILTAADLRESLRRRKKGLPDDDMRGYTDKEVSDLIKRYQVKAQDLRDAISQYEGGAWWKNPARKPASNPQTWLVHLVGKPQSWYATRGSKSAATKLANELNRQHGKTRYEVSPAPWSGNVEGNPAKKPALPWVAHEPGKSPNNALVWFARKSDAIKHAQTLADKLGKPFAVSRGTPKPFPKWEFGK